MTVKKEVLIDQEWRKKARSLGLMDQKHFKQAFEAYEKQISIAEKLRDDISDRGVSVVQPVGKDREKIIPNPSISLLQTTEKLAQSLRKELDDKMDKSLNEKAKIENDDLKL